MASPRIATALGTRADHDDPEALQQASRLLSLLTFRCNNGSFRPGLPETAIPTTPHRR
ncbi:hypothetical protein VARIO8X_20384 [Burkholderiales bacterium 8X]|nr:hypothetical protein VARIO8X_20384 [Burkholderiales bacterium 8X]